MKNVCFVSNEIFPVINGGIGKLLFDTICNMDKSGLYNVTLLLVAPHEQYQEFNAYCHRHFKNVSVYHLDKVLVNLDAQDNIPLWAFHFEEYYLSYRVAQALKILVKAQRIELIEFCDYLGLGYVTIKWKKLLSDVFENTFIQVKLHGTKEICDIADGESIYTKRQTVTYHMERYCLTHCDKWIAPSNAIASYYRTYYNIAQKETGISVPSFQKIGIGLSHPRTLQNPLKILFYGKVQKLKGIETFIKGALQVLDKTNLDVEFHIFGHTVYYDWCGSYEEHIKKIIPEKWQNHFLFKGRINVNELETVALEYAAAVVPSKFETFCLAAHELNWIGIPLIVNDIAAFEDYFTPNDAYRFNGTPEHLSEVLLSVIEQKDKKIRMNWNAKAIDQQAKSSSRIYEHNTPSVPQLKVIAEELVSIIIPYYNMHFYIDDAIRSVRNNQYLHKEIIIVNDGSPLPEAIKKLKDIQKAHPDITVLNKKNGGLGSARNFGISRAKGAYIVCLDSDDMLHPDFIHTSVNSLQRNPSLMAVSCFVNFFMDGTSPQNHIDYVIPYDLIPELIFIENRAGVATSVFRKDVFNTIRYNEELTSYEDWDLWWQMVRHNFKAEVIPQILFHYRRRGDSMINTEGLKKHIYHLHKMIDLNKDWMQPYAATIHRQMVTLSNELSIRNVQLQTQVNQFNNSHSANGHTLANGSESIYIQLKSVQDWYDKEYEVLPVWFKRIGHIVKVFQGNRKFKSLFENNKEQL